VLITNSLDALNRWRGDAKQRFFKLLNRIQHRIIPFKSIDQLFNIYGEGGIMVSPRYLDNAYNMGHTEWKVTLAMACGRIVLCSPVPSYVVVQQRAKGAGIRVCSDSETWEEELDSLLDNRIDRIDEERAAKQVVETYYATPVVAKEHAEYVRKIMVVS
jgi:glycosyltransferase involved in cell wall biosynthesis